MPSDYVYDVFLSYHHSGVVKPWVVNILYQQFCDWLTEKLGGAEAKVFIDRKAIQPGHRWPNRLRDAIKTSKCLVPVWSPSYFQSHWCMSEWRSFCEREEVLGINNTSESLIVPILHNDGDFFPQDAKDIHWTDFSECRSNMPAFTHHHSSVIFEQKIEEFAESVARVVQRARPFRENWPVVEADPVPPPKVPSPKL